MWACEVVVVEPSRQLGMALLGVVLVLGVDPFAQCSLDETFTLPLVRGV